MTLDMYQENILEHYRNPRNKGRLDPTDVQAKENNPLCGDVIEVFIVVDEAGRVADLKFEGEGCAISQASMSILSDDLKGKSVDEIQKMGKDEILELVLVPLSPVRLKCATLGIKTVQKGIAQYRARALADKADPDPEPEAKAGGSTGGAG